MLVKKKRACKKRRKSGLEIEECDLVFAEIFFSLAWKVGTQVLVFADDPLDNVLFF